MILTLSSSDPAPATAAMTAWRRASSKYGPPGARATGGATDSSTAFNGGARRAGGRHGRGDAATTESQRDMLDLTMTNAWSATTTTASTHTRHRGTTEELSEI